MKNLITLVKLLYRLILITASLTITVWPLLVPLPVVTNIVVIPSLLLCVFAITIYLEHKVDAWSSSSLDIASNANNKTNNRCIISGCPIFH